MPVQTRKEPAKTAVSVKDRINMYSNHVRDHGGAPPAPKPVPFKSDHPGRQGRRATLPNDMDTILLPSISGIPGRHRGMSAPFQFDSEIEQVLELNSMLKKSQPYSLTKKQRSLGYIEENQGISPVLGSHTIGNGQQEDFSSTADHSTLNGNGSGFVQVPGEGGSSMESHGLSIGEIEITLPDQEAFGRLNQTAKNELPQQEEEDEVEEGKRQSIVGEHLHDLEEQEGRAEELNKKDVQVRKSPPSSDGSAEQVPNWNLSNGSGAKTLQPKQTFRTDIAARRIKCRSSDIASVLSQTEEDKLRTNNTFLQTENRKLKQQLLQLQRRVSLEVDDLPTPIHRRKRSKAHTTELMIEVGHMDRVLSYTHVFKKFLLSEGRYLNKLLVLAEYFAAPFKLLVAYKPNVLSFNNYQSLFLNCEELVLFHKMFHTSLASLNVADEQALVVGFLAALEANLPYITVYGPYLASQLPMRRKLFSELMKNREFAEIVSYQEQTTEVSLKELLELPITRLQTYVEVLELTKNLPVKMERCQRGFEQLLQFVVVQIECLKEEPGEWAEMKKKLNVLEKLAPDSLVPVELFDSKTVLKKSGQLETKTNGKILPKFCFLFSRHFALATIERHPDRMEYKLDPPGLISLCGARVYSKVDVQGQAMQEDWDTGLEIDREAFLVELPHGRGSYLLKAHKPQAWTRPFSHSIDAAKLCTCNTHTASGKDLYFTANFGGNLAAASVDKLIALLINPTTEAFKEYIDIFFATYPAFVSPKALLESLIASAISYTKEGEKRESVVHPVYAHHLPNKYRNDSHFSNQFWDSDHSEKEGTVSPDSPLEKTRTPCSSKTHKALRKRDNRFEYEPVERKDSDETITPSETPRISMVNVPGILLDTVEEEESDDHSRVFPDLLPLPYNLVRKMSLSVPDLSECARELDSKDDEPDIFVSEEDYSPDNLSEGMNGSVSELEFLDGSPDFSRHLSPPSPTSRDFQTVATPTTMTLPTEKSRREGVVFTQLTSPPHVFSQMHPSVSNPERLGFESKVKDQVSQSKATMQDAGRSKRKKKEPCEQNSLTPQLTRKKKEKTIDKVMKVLKKKKSHSKRASESGSLEPASRQGSISSSLSFEDDGHELVQAMMRVLQVIEYWIQQYPEDFSDHPWLPHEVSSFLVDLEAEYRNFKSHDLFMASLQLSRVMQANVGKIDSSLPMLLHRVTGQELNYLTLLFGSDNGIISAPSKMDLLQLKPVELAQQLTLFEFAIFLGIRRGELLNTSWKGKKREKQAPNVLRAISEGNRIVAWVATEVLLRSGEVERAGAIEFFIQVAQECFKHHDLHSLTMVHSALSSYKLQRLKTTWAHVGQKYKEKLAFFKPYCDPSGRCKKMREHVKSKKPPCLPYLGAYLDQIWSLEQSKATKSSQDLINFSKMKSLHEIITSILKYQDKPYTFHPQIKIIRYIHTANFLSEEELYDLSKKYDDH